jgi:uncharacterized membrane-anchored protein YhcB (DUF1043 family)
MMWVLAAICLVVGLANGFFAGLFSSGLIEAKVEEQKRYPVLTLRSDEYKRL